ncbi:heavy-metal-associated domain-containing protein [Haloarchaeobius sp. HRN-SO-5]|uniref:heavy-metal-associated domain-containing protein n=1 Tax=Haloarchaeobius sp. HRN-SO-5 TaxID=3446118 RepID=UPI003EB98C34
MTTRIRVSGMTYETHGEVVEKAVRMADGVESVETDIEEQEVTIDGDVSVDEVIEKIRMAGYEAEPV